MIEYGLSIHVTDTATPWLRRLRMALNSDAVKPIVGRSAVNVIRQNFFFLDRSRANSLGGRRSHYYTGAAGATHFRPVSNGVIVSIGTPGIAARYFGPTIIRPRRKKVLAFPISAESYGKRAQEYHRRGRKTAGLFAFVKHVKMPRDRRVLPPDHKLYRAINEDLDVYFDSLN